MHSLVESKCFMKPASGMCFIIYDSADAPGDYSSKFELYLTILFVQALYRPAP